MSLCIVLFLFADTMNCNSWNIMRAVAVVQFQRQCLTGPACTTKNANSLPISITSMAGDRVGP